MHPTNEEKRQPLPSIASVYRPIEEFWEASRPAGLTDGGPSEALDPLDAFLVHRLLEFLPGRPVLVDAALAWSGGAAAVLGMSHPRVQGVWAGFDPKSPQSQDALAALRDVVAGRGEGLCPLKVVDRSELAETLAELPGAVILADARAGGPASLASDLGRWLDARPDALVLILGLGRVGECPAISVLVSLCSRTSGRRFRLLRELSEVLMSSGLGIVARCDHPTVDGALRRLEQLYIGNNRYVDLLWRTNRAAIREAGIDADVQRSHPTFGALSEEIEALKRAAREANERADAAARSYVPAWVPGLAAEPPPSPLVLLRRSLSPTPVGQAWRLAKRARGKLSPTPVGKAYRLTKRVALACIPRGR